ncbi:MAG: hypothetical protein HQ582_21970 [Planctomycetes bacterium]|nr:hypothetical protein [Planctomycetota bacterium]
MAVVALLFVVAPGCFSGNPKTYPVSGKVTFPDGRPLTKGTVEFVLMDQEKPSTATGEISEDGTYVLGTFKADDGAIAGRHQVVVIADHEIGTGAERPGLLPSTGLHPKYRSFKTSGLEFPVEPEKNEIDIRVDYAPRGRR